MRKRKRQGGRGERTSKVRDVTRKSFGAIPM
jgi:hypothetical protein